MRNHLLNAENKLLTALTPARLRHLMKLYRSLSEILDQKGIPT